MCSVGAGGFGPGPKIVSENNELKFNVGLHSVSVEDVVINPKLAFLDEKTHSEFEIFL